jgi:hypothetical protein
MRKASAKPERPAEAPAPGISENADDLDRCIADCFEDAPGGVMTAKAIRPLASAWFEGKGLHLDENKLWPKMRARFKHDPNNNRPRYFGLKPRVGALSPFSGTKALPHHLS